MKAVLFDQFGDSSVLRIAEVPKPTAKPGEVLIKISYTSVNPVDWKIREGYLRDMLPHRFPIISGWDLSGEIVEVGGASSSFSVGDLVYSYTRLPEVHSGTYAEYMVLPENFVAKKPSKLTLAEAAGVPLVALTAYQALHEVTKVQAGDKVLVTGGAGGVGAYAIQFAKLAGAEVTAVASTSNLSYMKELGAKDLIDYTKEELYKAGRKISPEGFDVIFDAVGASSLQEAARLKSANSRLVSIVESSEHGPFHFVYPNASQLTQIAKLYDSGSLMVPATEIRNIKEAAAAQDANAKRHGRGKVVLEISF